MLDFRYALRSLARARGFAIAVILTLGLGIGANTAIFSVIRGVMLKPLPNRDGDRLMYLRHSMNRQGGDNIAFSVPEINDFREASKTLGGIAEYSPYTVTLVQEREATRINLGLVTGNYFSVMGLSPEAGRALNSGDDGPGVPPVIMLTDEYWHKHFGGDPSIVGKTLKMGGKAVQVVGVLQPAPYFPTQIDALANMVNSEHHLSATMVQGRSHRMTEMIARLAPGATVAQARTEVSTITNRVLRDHPQDYDPGSQISVTLTPFREALGQNMQLTLKLLMGAAAFVLIIACANVANLTLMRGVRREHELMVRQAIGAGTTRLRKLLLVENLVLAGAGGVLGLGIAYGGVGMLTALAARYSPRANEINVDSVVLSFTLGLVLLVAVLLSFAPGLVKEEALASGLAAGGRRSTGGVKRQRLQRSLVVAQVAVSVVLLTGAGLLVRTMQRLANVDTGMDTQNVLTMEVPHDFGVGSVAKTIQEYQMMQARLAALPGVQEVAFGSTIPLRRGFPLEVKAEGHTLAAGEPVPLGEYRTTSPGYFRTSGIPLLKGRDFTETDRAGAQRVVILNKTLADKLFPGVDPIGRQVAWTGEVLKFVPISGDWRMVVGVVGDTKDGGLDAPPMPVVFMPFVQEIFPSGGFVIKARADAAKLATAATQAVRTITPTQPIENVLTADQIRDESVAPRRLNALLVASFGGLAMVIAAIGIAAVLAFSVSARTSEIGVRMSLGADAGVVQRMILSEGGVLVGLGLVLGIGGALSLARLVQGLLFGVAPNDPTTLAVVAVLMAAVGIASCWVPAIMAARIDPQVALRAQ